MSEPVWASPGRQFVPMHLQPGTTRSSFAKPDMYKLRRDSLPAAVAAQPQGKQRSNRAGFATKPRSKQRHAGTADADDELPPTQSIRAPQKENNDAAEQDQSHLVSSATGTPVIVFGFPPGATQAVLQHFGHLGEITENFAGNSDVPPVAASTIECGRNWLRITYRDPEGAYRALAQNGHVMPGQYVIGCVPAEQGESSTARQSTTNSLLVDDSDASILHEASLASILDEDAESSFSARRASGSHSTDRRVSDRRVSSASQVLPDRLSVRAPSTSIFRTEQSHPPKTLSEATTTKLPERTEATGFRGLLRRIGDAVFSWDL